MTFSRTDTTDGTMIAIEGALDALTVDEFRPMVEALVAEKLKKITLDVTALRMIDSSGVGAIVSLYKRVRAQGGSVTVTGLRGQPLAVIKLLRLDKVLAG